MARSADEAERLKRGEDVTVRREAGAEEDEAEAAKAAAAAMFEAPPADAGDQASADEKEEAPAKA